MKKFLSKKLIVVLMFLSTYLHASDIDGFFVSLGFGTAETNTNFEKAPNGWSNGDSGSEIGLAGSFKIGYGISDDVALYLFRNSAFVFGYDNDPNESTYGNCITGIGINYYFESSDTFYLLFGMGEAQFTKFTEADSEGQKGDGYILGLGVNLFPNVHLEWNILETEIDDEVKQKTEATQLTLNYYWY